MKRVLIVGLGTIGQPLALALLRLRQELNIDEVVIHKNTPRKEDVGLIMRFQDAGAKLCVYKEQLENFKNLFLIPDYIFEEILEQTDVVVDCTKDNMALEMKKKYYQNYEDKCVVFIAQGGAKGFGTPFAYNINDIVLKPEIKYLQIVSCNTHNILAVLNTFGWAYGNWDNVTSAHFYLQRRVSDISQKEGALGVEVGKPNNTRYGSHQAADAARVLETIGLANLDLHSRAHISPNSYMHVIDFNLTLRNPITLEEIKKRFRDNPLIAITDLTINNIVFSMGREWGHYGRILNQTVVCMPSLEILNEGYEIEGTCFTPQDGNSLLSSIAAIMFFLDKTKGKVEWQKKIRDNFYHPPFLFKRI